MVFIKRDISNRIQVTFDYNPFYKNYLFYLAEKKRVSTSTLNQNINALKFYYGSMLKMEFMYEIKKPRKDKKSFGQLENGEQL